MAATLSIVIPTFQAAGALDRTLRAIGAELCAGDEIVVVDAGSDDGTSEIAASAGARILTTARGRGAQLAAGSASAKCDWLLFLHADTVLEAGWRHLAGQLMADPAGSDRAGYYRLALDDDGPAARRIERMARWRARVLGLPYGDQGLLISRSLYAAVGAYRPLPLMEDVDLVRRVGRGRLVELAGRAVTSAARYRRDGWWLRPARNLLCLGLYFVGAPTRWIERVYG
jgi:rSAM/selenodomain-associated transferase 2